MTDEPSRDLDSQPDAQPDAGSNDSPAGRGRFAGITGRFRRRSMEPERNPAPGEDAPPDVSQDWAVPTPAVRPTDPADATDTTPVDDDVAAEVPEEAPEPSIPHAELHPALRREIVEDARAEIPAASDDPLTEDEEGAAAGESDSSTPVPTSPVVEERVAVTPRPANPAPPTAPPAAARGTASVLPAADDGPPLQPPPEYEVESSDVPALSRRLTGISAHLTVLTGISMAVVLAFLLIEPTPRWFLILGAGAVILGLDGTLRETWREPFAFGQETAPFLFVPALFMLSVPVLIEHNFQGEIVILAGIGAGLAFGSLAWAELASVRSFGSEYPQARILVTANTYLVGFAIFSLTYVYSIPLPAAIAACGIAAGMLAVEVLREGEIDPAETLGLALVTAVVIAEARWLFYYAPLDTYLAGLTLLLVFYLLTGLLHSHVVRALSVPVAAQYGSITAAGLALVIIARAAGLA